MNDYLILASDPAAYADFHFSTVSEELDGGYAIEVLHATDPLQPGDTIVAQRLNGEDVATILDEEIYKQIRPFGNEEDGSATGPLLYPYVDGWPIRVFSSTGTTYPPGNEPFDIEIRPWLYDEYADPSHGGWGWCAEMNGSYEERNPAARAVFVDAAPEGLDAGYTTGAFVLAESKWQVDEEGNPLQVWQTITPPGRNSEERGDWTITVLHGSAREGTATLHSTEDQIRYLFWEHNQGGGGQVLPWVQPTGAHDAYSIGDQVTHPTPDTIWESTHNDNVWEPGVFGWTEIGGGVALEEWVQPTGAHDVYLLGARVTHGGYTWESTHGANSWPPGVFGWTKV